MTHPMDSSSVQPSSSENMTLRALYLLAIIMVVDGHTTLGHIGDMGGLFRYYSFHLLLFAFGSGYLYRERGSFFRALLSRARRLLVPLYLWNIIYGIGGYLLRRFGGFTVGAPLNAYTLLLAPLTDGQHFVWNLGSWFLFPLFLAQTLYSLLRHIARLWRDHEGITFVFCLIAGSLAVENCYRGHADALPLFLNRTLILLPSYAGGQLYKRCLEHHDRLPTAPYLISIVIVRALLCVRYENLAYLLSDCSYFACGAFGVYVGGTLAIAFWLRIARLLAPLVARSRLALYASRHTFAIMMHHFMGFFALNSVFLVCNALGIAAADFSVKSFRTNYRYNYAPGGRTEWDILYILAGIFFSLGIAFITEQLSTLYRKRFPR